jgi:peptide/nickel transport system permease protein
MTVGPGALSTMEVEPAVEPDEAGAIKGRSLRQIAWHRLKQDKVALAGGITVLVVMLLALLAPVITKIIGVTPNDFNAQELDPATTFPTGGFGGAGWHSGYHHILGIVPVTGQDVLARVLYGARVSLIIAFAATFLSVIIGTIVGVTAGYFGGWVDSFLSRFMDIMLAFPVLLFSIALIVIISSVHSVAGLSGVTLEMSTLIVIIGFFGFAYIGRIIRGQTLSLREKEFVDASRSLGASTFRILFKELLPNLIAPILVYATLTIPTNVLTEAALSFLGVGIKSPTASWGQMLSDATTSYTIDPFYMFVPGMAIFITVMAFNLFGDGLRDAIDPKTAR